MILNTECQLRAYTILLNEIKALWNYSDVEKKTDQSRKTQYLSSNNYCSCEAQCTSPLWHNAKGKRMTLCWRGKMKQCKRETVCPCKREKRDTINGKFREENVVHLKTQKQLQDDKSNCKMWRFGEGIETLAKSLRSFTESLLVKVAHPNTLNV